MKKATSLPAFPLPNFPDDFERVGYYEPARFVVKIDNAANYRCVYCWAELVGNRLIPRRFGVACGKRGLESRFRLHDRWIGGTFKRYDLIEQEKRRLTIQHAGPRLIVMAHRMPSPEEARALERALRLEYRATSTLDFSVWDSPVAGALREFRQQLRDGFLAQNVRRNGCTDTT